MIHLWLLITNIHGFVISPSGSILAAKLKARNVKLSGIANRET
jgi:hypothetical protein